MSKVNRSVASSPESLRAQEGPPPGVGPAGCRTEPSGGQDPPDGAGAYAVAESGEFALDPAVAPGGEGFSRARCSTRAWISSVIGGRPDRLG